jgi:hypothetical protein
VLHDEGRVLYRRPCCTRAYIAAVPTGGAAVSVGSASAGPALHRTIREDAMRSKLKLNLDQLAVDSFDTTVTERPKGTVFGEQCTCYTNCTCPGCPTCDATCPATCAFTCDDPSCAGTCNCPDQTYDYTCEGCTMYDATCRGYGTCGIYPCKDIP